MVTAKEYVYSQMTSYYYQNRYSLLNILLKNKLKTDSFSIQMRGDGVRC
jgi:hypothetical protein